MRKLYLKFGGIPIRHGKPPRNGKLTFEKLLQVVMLSVEVV